MTHASWLRSHTRTGSTTTSETPPTFTPGRPLLKSGVRTGADHVLQATIQLSTRSWATPKLSESVQSKSSGSVRNLQRFLFLHKKFLTADDGGASIGFPARRATRNMWSSSRICKRVLHNKKTGALTAERYLHRCTINVIVIILTVAPVAAFHRDIRALTIRTWPRTSLNKDLFDCAPVAFLRLTPEEMASSPSQRSFNCPMTLGVVWGSSQARHASHMRVCHLLGRLPHN